MSIQVTLPTNIDTNAIFGPNCVIHHAPPPHWQEHYDYVVKKPSFATDSFTTRHFR